jgi:hypothetical protein
MSQLVSPGLTTAFLASYRTWFVSPTVYQQDNISGLFMSSDVWWTYVGHMSEPVKIMKQVAVSVSPLGV